MSLLPLDPLTLAARLGLTDPTIDQLQQLNDSLSVASSVLDPRVDPDLLVGNEACYTEGCYGIGVRVWDASTRGVVDVNPEGMAFSLPTPTATWLVQSVAGIVGPILRFGGVVFA